MSLATPSALGEVTHRDVLIDCYRAALAAVDARRCVRESLLREPLDGDWHLIAIGKAAGAMAQGAVEVLAQRVAGGCVVVPPSHLPAGFDPGASGLELLVATHPVPDERSLAAGEAVAHYVAVLPDSAQVLFLVSGGASSLVEWLRPGVTLDELRTVNRWALTSGAPIRDVNAARRRLSRLKGGGLARVVAPRTALALMISDVPRDDPRVIGSGLLHASGSTVPKVPVRMVATLREACEAAAAAARTTGFETRVSPRRLSGEAAALGRTCARRLARSPGGTLQVWGGESTVTLPPRPGRGGRNQHLALAAAIEFESRGATRALLLAAGTDGIDGASPDAGAVVDAGTCMRGRDAGYDPHVSLASADSGSFLEAAGDLLHTGATLTNVGDLVLGFGSIGGG